MVSPQLRIFILHLHAVTELDPTADRRRRARGLARSVRIFSRPADLALVHVPAGGR
jgi:hypothetical protein